MGNLKIRTKLLLGFAVIIVINIAFAGYSYWALNDISSEKIELVKRNMRISENLVMLRKLEKDYYLNDLINETYYETGSSDNIENFGILIKVFKENINIIKQNRSVRNNEVFVGDLDEILALIDYYEMGFESAATFQLERGFNENGLIGALGSAISNLERYAEIDNDDKLTILILKARRAEKNYFLSKDTTYGVKVLTYIKNMKQYVSSGPFLEEDKTSFLSYIKSYEEAFNKISFIDQQIGLSELEGLKGVLNEAVDQIEPIVEHQSEQLDEMIDHDVDQIRLNMNIAVVISLLTSGLIALVLSNYLSKPIKSLVHISKKMANGDLTGTIEVKSKDEIGQLSSAFINMKEELSLLINQIKIISGDVLDSSFQLASVSQESGGSAEETARAAESLNESSILQTNLMNKSNETVEDLIDELSRVGTFAMNVRDASNSVHVSSEKGETSIDEAIRQMTAIKGSTMETGATIGVLKEKSGLIGDIVSVITSISQQTNLLALNAAIEAARAGEHGRGFAVVADEVRKLAENTQTSTEEISNLIKDIQNQIEMAITTMNSSVLEVETGTTIIEETGQMFGEIKDEVGNMTSLIQSLNNSMVSLEESGQHALDGMNRVTDIVRQSTDSTLEVSSAAEEQSAMAQEISSQAEQVSNLADKLIGSTEKFRV